MSRLAAPQGVTMNRARQRLLGFAIVGCLVTGCSGGTADADLMDRRRQALPPGDSLPELSTDPILTIELQGGHEPLVLDRGAIEAIGLADVRVDEPYVRERLSFSGLPIEDLVAFLDIPRSASLHVHALDDYVVDLDVDDLIESGAVLATTEAGDAIPISEGGPIRFVFAAAPLAPQNGLWIWSVDEITVVVPR